MNGQYKRVVALGGTFDHLHKGHKSLIRKALQLGDRLIIGLSSDEYLSRWRKNHSVNSYEKRLDKLKSFLSELNVLGKVTVVPLDDPFGPSVSDSTISVLVVTGDTLERALEINKIRISKKLPPLQIYVCDFILADDGAPISSTRIRKGQIDEEGHILEVN
ncbi:phosphopantetheine adenylyltransferase [Candidatus Bathyarchaeota archaeon]|nr:phosphopantetheine adenylyltransferase [Candidatus Bathyarchaeota archaeon]MBS7629259.1 phosphopantetheine adenylyltransferase [Candidatus Bathyarchaeota archaeon]